MSLVHGAFNSWRSAHSIFIEGFPMGTGVAWQRAPAFCGCDTPGSGAALGSGSQACAQGIWLFSPGFVVFVVVCFVFFFSPFCCLASLHADGETITTCFSSSTPATSPLTACKESKESGCVLNKAPQQSRPRTQKLITSILSFFPYASLLEARSRRVTDVGLEPEAELG